MAKPIIACTLLLGAVVTPLAIPEPPPSYRGYENTFILPVESALPAWEPPTLDRINADVWIIDPFNGPESGEFYQYLRRS